MGMNLLKYATIRSVHLELGRPLFIEYKEYTGPVKSWRRGMRFHSQRGATKAMKCPIRHIGRFTSPLVQEVMYSRLWFTVDHINIVLRSNRSSHYLKDILECHDSITKP